jgi:hypothetical protein
MESETLTYPVSSAVEFQRPKRSNNILAVQRLKNEVARRLLQAWLADDSGYDEKVWKIVKKAIEKNKLSSRKRFNDKTRYAGFRAAGKNRSSAAKS